MHLFIKIMLLKNHKLKKIKKEENKHNYQKKKINLFKKNFKTFIDF